MSKTAFTGFMAYPSEPREISQAMLEAQELSTTTKLRLEAWERMQIIGLKLDDVVRRKIENADVVLADITFANFNVYYELGYALALERPIIPLLNVSFENSARQAQKTGIFDTLGWLEYQNSAQLISKLTEWQAESWSTKLIKPKNHSQPLFFLDTLTKTNDREHVMSAISNSQVNSRIFDPSDNPRLTSAHAIAEVSSSAGVIVLLLKDGIVGARENNLRAAFVAGLAHGYGIQTLILQFDGGPAPVDYRDRVTNSNRKLETERHVEDFCNTVLVENQKISRRNKKISLGLLSKIDLGSSNAEGERQQLADYFVATAEYARAVRSGGSIIIGRKGSGKSAIGIRAESELGRNGRNLIIELKPSAHNLSDLREQLLSTVGVGLFDHTIGAFWQYVVLLEIILAIRERLLKQSARNFAVQERLRAIEKELVLTDDFVGGEFTGRLDRAISDLLDVLREKPAPDEVRERITNAMYESVVPRLREIILELSANYDDIVLIVDDLDKNWPPRRLENYDVRMVRHLIEVLKRIKRDFSRKDINCEYLLCIRSDVYDVLLEETADRGKDTVIAVDWSDRAQLEHLIRERIISSFGDAQGDEAWDAFNAPMKDGRPAIDHLIDTSLFRPRFLIEVCERVLSAAVNRGHGFVEEADVELAMEQMSLYLVSDFANEMKNVAGTPDDIFYAFIGTSELLTHEEVLLKVSNKIADIDHEFLIDLLIWYGFLGVVGSSSAPVFIYDRNYDFKRLLAERPQEKSERLYGVNEAFVRGLRQNQTKR